MFYLGSSSHLRDRASTWRSVLSGRCVSRKSIWPSVIDKIYDCKEATFEVVCFVPREDLLKEEEKYMTDQRGNPMMINQILHPKNEIIVKNLQGVELYRYPSLQGLAAKLGLYTRRIQDVCDGRRNKTSGYIFEYANKHLRKPVPPKPVKPKKEKPIKVLKYTVTGELVGQYTSTRAAAKDTGVDKKCMYNALRGIQKTTGGFVFKFA